MYLKKPIHSFNKEYITIEWGTVIYIISYDAGQLEENDAQLKLLIGNRSVILAEKEVGVVTTKTSIFEWS